MPMRLFDKPSPKWVEDYRLRILTLPATEYPPLAWTTLSSPFSVEATKDPKTLDVVRRGFKHT